MKLKLIVAAFAMMLGTAAYADMASVTTTSVKTTSQTKAGMHHHRHGQAHRHHAKKHYQHNRPHHRNKSHTVKRVDVREETSPPGSVTIIK